MLFPDLGGEEKFWKDIQKNILGGTMYGCSIVGSGTEAQVDIDGEFCG